MTTFENWQDWTFNGPLVGAPFSSFPIVPHSCDIPGNARQFYVWIGLGAFRQENSADDWYVQGRLRFSLNNAKTGELLVSDASSSAAAVFTAPAPERPIMRIRADASGSTQPVLRMQVASNPAWTRDNLDIGCFFLPDFSADNVQLEITDGRVSVAVGRQVLIRTGFRIVAI
jgi:hypothetical protein